MSQDLERLLQLRPKREAPMESGLWIHGAGSFAGKGHRREPGDFHGTRVRPEWH